MLTIYYSGLIGFDLEEKTHARALLVTMQHAVHLPRLLLDYEQIEEHKGIKIDMPVDARTLGTHGELLGMVDLSNYRVLIDGLKGNKVDRKSAGRTGGDATRFWATEKPTKNEREDLSWIPEMGKVVKDPKLSAAMKSDDPNKSSQMIGACIDVKTGLFATDERAFDRESGVWEIKSEHGKNYDQHTSDMLKFTADAQPNQQVTMKFWKLGDDPSTTSPEGSIVFKPEDIDLCVTCFPQGSGSTTTAEHFKHYAHLLENQPGTAISDPTLKTSGTTKAVYPVKCPPVIFP